MAALKPSSKMAMIAQPRNHRGVGDHAAGKADENEEHFGWTIYG